MNKDFARGMIVSMALKALPVRKKSPIAYLYNGVRLPALPEWDREAYPYAFIWYVNLESTGLEYYYVTYCKSISFSVEEPAFSWYDPYSVVSYEDAIGYALNAKSNLGWEDTGSEDSGSVEIERIKWSNFTVIDAADNSVCLEASDPIPIYNEPDNYLYNGVRLPKLPEWDREAYPYAVIVKYSNNYLFYGDNSELTIFADGTTTISSPFVGFLLKDGDWVSYNYGGAGFTPIWTNHDLYNSGAIVLAASEPIPIYE